MTPGAHGVAEKRKSKESVELKKLHKIVKRHVVFATVSSNKIHDYLLGLNMNVKS